MVNQIGTSERKVPFNIKLLWTYKILITKVSGRFKTKLKTIKIQ